jgi:hypothetical protein
MLLQVHTGIQFPFESPLDFPAQHIADGFNVLMKVLVRGVRGSEHFCVSGMA